MVGLPGAGKTTRARWVERERRALRFTPDEWMAELGFDLFDTARRRVVEGLQWRLAARALELGIDAVLDFGFWSRAERGDLRSRAAALGAESQRIFVDVPRDELLARLRSRNAQGNAPDTAAIDEHQLAEYEAAFEAPGADELA
jgi:predicted kinase